MQTTFDPSNETAAPAKAKAKRAAAPVLADWSRTVADELKRRTALTVAGYTLLAEIERRTEEIAPGSLDLADAEEELLAAAGIHFADRHELCRILDRTREARLVCEAVRQEPIEDVREQLDAAIEAESTAAANIGGIDAESANGTLAEQIRKLQAKLDQLKADREAAESRLRNAEGRLATLERLAPPPLQRLVQNAVDRVDASPEHRRLLQLDESIASLKVAVDPSHPAGVLHDPIEYSENNGTLWGFIDNHCPAARIESEHGPRIDRAELVATLNRLQTQTLPALRDERDLLRPAVEAVKAEATAPLRKWAETGSLTAELLAP